MPIKITPIKKKKKSPKGGGPLMTPGQKKMLDKQTGRAKPQEAKSGGIMKKAGGGKLKAVPEGKKGLSKLPTPVRNKMGFMKKGGMLNKKGKK